MDVQDLSSQVLSLPDQIKQAELALIDLYRRKLLAEDNLKNVEARLLMQGPEGPITGKNSETREAQLFIRTHDERHAVWDADAARRKQEAEVEFLRRQFDARIALLQGK